VLVEPDLAPVDGGDAVASLAGRRRPWLVASGAIVIVLLLAQGPAGGALRALGLLPRADAYTELYTSSSPAPPDTVVAGTRFTFRFTIHNVEHRPVTYRWQTEAVQGGSATALDQGSVAVADGRRVEILAEGVMPENAATVGTTPAPVLVRVDLIDQHQFVQFFVRPVASG